MQNFRNNAVPPALPLGFPGGSAVGGANAPYLSQSSGPQCSPRMAEEYAAVQHQSQQNPPRPNQHPNQIVTHHPPHASHILAYGGRTRGNGTGEVLQSHASSGGSSISANNPYRKELMDHYFSMSGKDRHRRGGQGLGYGLGFGYPNMDGLVPHQYRHAGVGSSGMMAHYPLDYNASTGSGGGGNSGSSGGAFSPSHQYSLSQNASIQSGVGPSIHSRQQAQNYSSQQVLHQGQLRGYPTSGHRMPLQFPQYSSPNAPTGTPGMYNSPPQRYHGGNGSSGFECKVNSSSTANTNPSSVSSTNSNSIGPIDGAGHSYPSVYSPYHSQPPHSLHKQAPQPHRGSHHNLALGYDASQKTHSSSQLHQSPAPGLNDPDNRAGPTAIHPANPSMPHLSPQEISKSPMHSQSHQPQVHQNFSPISNPSPAASTVQSPSCSSSPSPLMGSSEQGTTSALPQHGPSHPLVQKTRSSHSHGRLLQTLPQLSPTPNSSSSISSCGSSSGNVNIAGLNPSSGTVSSSVRPCTAAGVGEENTSTLHPSSPLDKLGPESAINSLNALTSQVANLPNTVQHSVSADSSVTHKFGKDGGYSDHMREHLIQPSMHTLPINPQRSRVVGDHFGTKPGREGTVAFGREIANSEGGVVDDTAVVPGSPMSGREEEHCSAREGERVRQVSGASSSSEKTGSHPLSHNHRNKIQPQTERSGQSLTLQVETEAVTHTSRALTSPTIPQPRKIEYEARASFPKTPPSSSPSSRPPSPQSSPKLPSSCPPASLVPTFSSTSPSVIPPFHASHATKTTVDSQNSGGETENEGEGKSKGEESDEWRHGRDTKANSTEARDRDKYGWKEGMEMHSKPSKRTLEECEKQEMAQYLEDSCTNPNTLETHNASVGVIVSTRSENPQSGTMAEAQTASTCAAPHSLHKSHNLRNFSEEGLAHSSAGDSHRLNGEDLNSLCTFSSNHETKMRHKRSQEHSVSPPLPSSETEVTSGSSKVLHGTGTEFRNRGRGVMGTDVKYQGYHQPLPSYNVGQRKAAGIAAVDEPSRRGSGVDAVRGQECNSELQQTLPQPSLLQEVLQGYHLDRRYGRTENLKQKVSNACSESTAYQSHTRHHYITPESARPQVLVSELGIRRDHQSHTGAVTSGKHHTPNPGQVRDRVAGQDTSSHPLDSGGPGTKEEYCGVYKKQIGASPIHSSPSVEQSAQSTFPPPKHINLADYSLPHRRPASSLSSHSPAVQQILLQTPEPVPGIGVSKSQSRTHASSSSSLSNVSSSERRSVICDVSPSHRITPERERDGETGHGRSHSLKGGSVASVIQQSHSTPSVMQELEKSKVEQDKDTVVDFKAISKTTEEAQNLTSKSGHFQVEEASIQQQFHSPRPSVDTNSDTQQLSNRRKVESNSICSPSTPQASEHALSNPSPLCSTPSSCQPYFQGLDKASGHCTGLGRYGFGEMRVGTPKATPYQQKYPSHPQHNVPLQAQPENSKSLKLHPHSLNQPNALDEQCEWAASNNSRSAENMMSSRSVRPPHQSPQGRRSLDCLPGTQHHLQGNFYDPAKIWGLSERDGVGSVEGGSSQRNPRSAASGAVALPATAASGGRCAQTNAPREELVKSLHQGAASSSQNPSVCNNSSSSSGSTYANLGVQQGHGQNRLGGSGDGNPLMMRRRVRSFISPIPAKRQHQDLSQHQRGPSNQFLSPQPNCESKQQTDASPSPDPFHAKMAIPNAPSPTHGKTKILPPRKGRGLKLEAIVQKITPNVKKSSTSNSHTESNHHSGLPNAQVSDCNPETQEEDSCVEANFLRVGSVTGSCLPYLGESLSLDEIMYYKGVEETGPLPPSAYPCDPNQDPQVPKRDAAGKITRGNIRDMEPDFGIKASVPPITERDGVLERGKDELEIDSDFTLLGPLPPPPPLPRPVQASSPPSSSALSDIQNFTNTYQQLETRKGEHSAANLLRQKLQETGMGLGMDDYAGTDYFGTQPSHHNQNVGACMLNRASHMYQQHLIPSARTPSSIAGLSQLPESKPPESVVPKGYFPSGKKKGRPVGSVNKQKRVQAQAQNASIQTPAVTGTESLLQTPAPTPSLDVTEQIVSSSSSAAATSDTSLPTDDKISSVSISTTEPETVKTDVDSKDVQFETDLKPGEPNERGDEDEEGEKVWVGSRTRRRRRRVLVGIVEKEDLPAQTQDQFSGYGSFPGYRKSVFAPYIHVERKEVELGAVCTIVNAEDEQMKGENGGDGETDVVLTAISQGTKVDREMEKARETKETEPVISALLESSTSGKVLPSSGYVLSGVASTESHHLGQLLCCLCNKWANYKNLGDLYGPYYPPDYPSKLPKSQTRQSLLTSRACSVGTVSTEATDLNVQLTEAQTANSVMPTLQVGCQDVDPVPVAANYTVCPPGGRDLSALCDSINRVDTDGKELQHHDLSQATANSDGLLKHYEQSELMEKPQPQLQIQQWTAEEVHQRPQHRKLTSHPRFKRRHRSNEDLPKSTPTNSKASLPFQPPPQQFNPDTSEPLSQSDQLAQLPRVPLDPEELWVHEGCIVWASGVYLVNGRLHGLKEALDGARDALAFNMGTWCLQVSVLMLCDGCHMQRCSHCEDLGPTLGCYIKGCTLRYHYLCAVETDCSLNEDNFSLRCLKHKVSDPFVGNFRQREQMIVEEER